MNVLLDTNVFLWMSTSFSRLSKRAKRICADPGNTLFLSSISAAEICIKYRSKKLTLPHPPAMLIPEVRMENYIQSLPLDERASLHLDSLPAIHSDPFDRLLICQAITQNLVILTSDTHIKKYKDVKTIW